MRTSSPTRKPIRKLAAAVVLAAVTTGGAVALPGAAYAADPHWSITLHADRTQLQVGHTVTFTGTVSPAAGASHLKAVLQERFKPTARWTNQTTTAIGPNGGFTLTDKPTQGTVHSYRVLVHAGAEHARTVSAPVQVSAYAWTSLLNLPQSNSYRMYDYRRVLMDGVRYDSSVSAGYGVTGHLEFDLRHSCIALRSELGINDSSEIGASAELDLRTEQGELYDHVFDLGQSTYRTFRLDSPLKLRVSSASVYDSPRGYAALGTPQVLCSLS